MNIFKKICLSIISLTMVFAIVGFSDVKAAEELYEVESNDTKETANDAYLDTVIVGSIGESDQNDYYRISTSKVTYIAIVMMDNGNLLTSGTSRVEVIDTTGKITKLQWFELDGEYEGMYGTYVKLGAGINYIHLNSTSTSEIMYLWIASQYAQEAQKILNVSSSYTITYKDPKYVAYTLKAKASGGGKISYKSQNTKILTIDSAGRIKTKAYGKTTIKITAAAPTSTVNYANLLYKGGTKTITVTVRPKAVSNAKIANYTVVKKKKKLLKKQLKVTWSKDKLATGYQVEIAKNKKFTSGKKSVTISKNSTVSKTFTGLKKGSKYYMRIRAYKTIGNKKVYGPWSTTASALKVN